MLSEDEFESALLKLKWHGCVDSEEANVLRAHDREQRAEIERLKAVNHRLHLKVIQTNADYARQLSAREHERTEQEQAA